MHKTRIRLTDIIYWLALLGADLFIYLVLGVLQMEYEDHWDKSKGVSGSFASMNRLQITYYVALQIWNMLNLIGLLYVGYKIYCRITWAKNKKGLNPKP